jgi:hypothetical protein
MGSVLAAVPPRADDVEITYLDQGGDERRGPLSQLWHARFESMRPVRGFPSFPGQRSFSGAWWCATTGEHVGFESWLERDHVMLLDFDPLVVGVASQPFWLSWPVAGRRRRHVPDYFVRLSDGRGLVVDVRPDGRIEPTDAEAFAMTGAACESVGWQYSRVGAIEPVLAANLRWLAAYRHHRCRDRAHAGALSEVFAEPRPLDEGVELVGDRLGVLPTLFHLLWAGILTADLASSPLSGTTMVASAGVTR